MPSAGPGRRRGARPWGPRPPGSRSRPAPALPTPPDAVPAAQPLAAVRGRRPRVRSPAARRQRAGALGLGAFPAPPAWVPLPSVRRGAGSPRRGEPLPACGGGSAGSVRAGAALRRGRVYWCGAGLRPGGARPGAAAGAPSRCDLSDGKFRLLQNNGLTL